jgi:hypothetical protein
LRWGVRATPPIYAVTKIVFKSLFLYIHTYRQEEEDQEEEDETPQRAKAEKAALLQQSMNGHRRIAVATNYNEDKDDVENDENEVNYIFIYKDISYYMQVSMYVYVYICIY